MTRTKERNELIEKIKRIQDPNVLEELYRLLDINIDETIYKLNDQQKKEIAQARDKINRGEGIPSEQLDKEIDEWLKE